MKLLIKRQCHKKGGILRHCSGQATTELAIMGAIVMMLLAYLVQQGFLYNARQGLEMYTFREALSQSRGQERGIMLTVLRDVISPSFFSGINKQRLMASASVDFNPWVMWQPDDPEDLPTKQLLQIGEGMIRNGVFIEVPPTHVYIETNNEDEDPDQRWQWQNSSPRQIGVQPRKVSDYMYITQTQETPFTKTVVKDLSSTDVVDAPVTFENKDRIVREILADNWYLSSDDDYIRGVDLDEGTIPHNANLILEETVYKAKSTTTPH